MATRNGQPQIPFSLKLYTFTALMTTFGISTYAIIRHYQAKKHDRALEEKAKALNEEKSRARFRVLTCLLAENDEREFQKLKTAAEEMFEEWKIWFLEYRRMAMVDRVKLMDNIKNNFKDESNNLYDVILASWGLSNKPSTK